MSNINYEKALASNIAGYFNPISKTWWSQDITNNQQGSITDNLTSTSTYYQLINSTTPMINANSSCIDLIFNSNPNLITEFGIEIVLKLEY